MCNVQTIIKKNKTSFERALIYYKAISASNNIKLSPDLLEFLAYLSTEQFSKKVYMEKYRHSEPTVNNIIVKLKKMGFLKNERGNVSLTDWFSCINFEEDLQLILKLKA